MDTVCFDFGLSLCGRGTVAGSFSYGHFNGSLGYSLLETSFLSRSFWALPPPAGHRVLHPSVESHHHSSQSPWDGSLLRRLQAGPSIKPLSSPQKCTAWLAIGGSASTDSAILYFALPHSAVFRLLP